MTPFLALLSRELRARWMLLAAAFAMGCFIALISLVPNSRGARPEEVRAAAGLAVALVWATLLAIGLGATALARDLGERRLAFDFRLPVSATAIWGARLLGAYLVVLLAGLLVYLPLAPLGLDLTVLPEAIDMIASSAFAHGERFSLDIEALLAWLPLLIAGLLLLSHLAGMAVFGDRAWSGFDLLSLGLVVAATVGGISMLQPWRASGGAWNLVVLVVALLLLALLGATLLQLRLGRSERDRSHRVLSLSLLGLTLFPAAASLGYARWYLSPELRDLVGYRVTAHGLGAHWVSLEGQVDRPGELWVRFLLQPATRRALRLGPHPPGYWNRSVRISDDGSTLAWLDRYDQGGRVTRQLVTLDADRPDASPARSPLAWRTPISAWSLSGSGIRVATLQRTGDYWDPRRVVVESVARGDLIAALLLPECRSGGALRFATDDRVLVACAPRDMTPYETEARLFFAVDLRERRLLPFDSTEPRDWASEDEDSGSAVRDPGGRWHWRDPASGELVPLLDEAQYRAR